MSEQVKVEAGTRFNDVGDSESDGYWEWTGEAVVYWTPTSRIRSCSSLGDLLAQTRSGHMFLYHLSVPTPDPRDAVVAAARKIYTAIKTRQLIDNPLNSTGEDELMLQYFDALDEALSALDRAGGGK